MKKGIHMMIWIHFFFLFELRTLLQNEARNATKLGEEKSRPQKVNSSQSQLHVVASTELQNLVSLDRMFRCQSETCDMYFSSENWGILHFQRATTQMRTTQIDIL